MKNLHDQLASLSTSFEKARSSWERIDRLIEDVGAACSQAIASGLHQFVAELKQQERATDAERERIVAAMANLQATLSQTLERLQDERTAAQERSLEVLKTTRSVISEALERIHESLREQQNSQAEGFVRGLRGLAQEIRDLHMASGPRTNTSERVLRAPDLSWDVPSQEPSLTDAPPEPEA